MRTTRATVGSAAALLVLALVGPSLAEPRRLGLGDLTEAQQRALWQRVDDDAGYAALLTLCRRDTAFERRFVEAVRDCVDAGTLGQVASFYRSRYAATLTHANRRPCEDPGFVQRGLPDKLAAILDAEVSQARSLCEGYRRTGMAGHR